MKWIWLIFFSSSLLASEAFDYKNYQLIPQGEVIFDIKTRKAKRIQDNLVVRIKGYHEDEDFVVIQTKNEGRKYLVHFRSLQNLEPVLNMERKPYYFQKTSFKEKKKTIEARNSFDHSIHFDWGIASVQYLAERGQEFAVSNNLRYRGFFNTKKGWNLGANLNWQNTKSLGKEDLFSFDSISLGPSLRFEKGFFDYDLILEMNQSLSSRMTIKKQGTARLHQTTFAITLTKETDYLLGTSLMGFFLHYSRLKLRDSTINSTFSGKLNNHFTFGVTLGHGFY